MAQEVKADSLAFGLNNCRNGVALNEKGETGWSMFGKENTKFYTEHVRWEAEISPSIDIKYG